MAKILTVDDEEDILEVLQFHLRQAGHEVFRAATGRAGLELALKERPDLMILDHMLPDLSGAEVCRTLRSRVEGKYLPVMMLTARADEVDRVVCFELGADDYVTKPFSARELLLRVRAILRRAATPPGAAAQGAVEFGILRLDPGAHRVWVADVEIELTALEFRLLKTLHERRNRVQTRSTLLSDIWGIDADISTRTVDAHVKRLREKLGQAGNYVETVRGVGYRFADAPDLDEVNA